MINVVERGYRDSCLGRVLQLKVSADSGRLLYWHEVQEAFAQRYPHQWAVQVFPPDGQVVDSKNVYHLFVCTGCPEGLNLRQE